MKKIIHLSFFLFLPFLLMAQNNKEQVVFQTIRGTIVDDVTKSPLTGAAVIIVGSKPIKGAISDAQGDFILKDIPLGRITLKVSYMGYADRYLNNLDLYGGKQLVLNISLEENVITTATVDIVAQVNKERPINEIATVSARTFSVEETQRYAGSLGDPSRMAQNYAGVMGAGDSRNDIVIRGNSPMGLLWRMEGIDIPNPNHFAATGTTGGPVSMLNNNLLSNSDFFTGAFPAEYGNALSGVFDLQMRNGNNQEYEFVGQVGFNGFELGAEGPFSKKSNGSFLVNYRYSTMAVMEAIGIDFGTGSSVPQYQDLTFKINLPTKKAGRFVLYGIGGKSSIQLWDSKKEDDEASYGVTGTDTDFGSETGVLGFYNVYYLTKNTRLKTNLSVSGTRATTALDSLMTDNVTKYQFYRSNNSEVKYSASTHLTHKFSAKDMMTAGVIVDHFQVSYVDSVYRSASNDYFRYSDAHGDLNLYQAYAQWKHKFSDNLNFNVGLHYQFFDLNNSQAIEPRAGLEWKFTPKQSISFGYGLLSQTQPKILYFVETELPNGQSNKSNLDMGFTKSNQFVLGYNNQIGRNFRIKAEAYYQHLTNVPVSQSMPNYSVLNVGADFNLRLNDSLINQGTGDNYGIELTLEKFLSKRFYILGTASIFKSLYKGYNEKEHSTAFDNNYVFNALGGYEIPLPNGMRINIDLRGVYAGGKPYTPWDEQKTIANNSPEYLYDQSYSERHKDYFRIDLKIGFRMSLGKTDHEYVIEIQNMTNHKNVYQQVWDPVNQKMKIDYQQGFFPMFMYRVHF
ncbi:MAG: TonB-dependent receptor [Bacteroidales bacterium]|nr:TonB-dependent receptor [Bacteroidales bacterium]